MFKLKNITFSILFFIVVQIFTGCTVLEPFRISKPTLGPRTAMDNTLSSLPPPKEQIITAVYTFRDQTGQYKINNGGGTSFSTAVTQGATSILLRALELSGWFVPIEREGLSDLLSERKIIRSSREMYMGADGKKLPGLPPLLYAGIILEGGIISYDSNVLTGGEGVKYFGISASGQYHQDRVTVYLRATSTQSGKILKTVYSSKTILSQAIDAGVYRFVSVNQLLQAEMGVTYNEPVDIAVTEAIQKAVKSLIIEGVEDGLWSLKNPADSSSPAFTNYKKELQENQTKDFMGRPILDIRNPFSINVNTGVQKYLGDYPNSEINSYSGLILGAAPTDNLFLEISLGRGIISAQNSFRTNIDFANVRFGYYLINGFKFSPYFLLGGGLLIREKMATSVNYPVTPGYAKFASVLWGGGIEYRIINNIGINFEFTTQYLLNDNLDGLVNGKYYDYFWKGNIGLNFYFGN